MSTRLTILTTKFGPDVAHVIDNYTKQMEKAEFQKITTAHAMLQAELQEMHNAISRAHECHENLMRHMSLFCCGVIIRLYDDQPVIQSTLNEPGSWDLDLCRSVGWHGRRIGSGTLTWKLVERDGTTKEIGFPYFYFYYLGILTSGNGFTPRAGPVLRLEIDPASDNARIVIPVALPA